MRIAQIAPLSIPIPPAGYGGIERVVQYLCQDLTELGDDVTLFAAEGSIAPCKIVEVSPALGNMPPLQQAPIYQRVLAERRAEFAEFDVLHFHLGYQHFAFAKGLGQPNVSTCHLRIDIDPLRSHFLKSLGLPHIAVAEHQRGMLPEVNWFATIGLGVPDTLYSPRYEPGNYLAFIGRIHPDKGVAEAIEIARRCRMKLVLAGDYHPQDADYFNERVRPHIESREVYYVGNIGDAQKQKLFERAFALLFPIQWPEPFGTVMIEAMACGTPVVAFNRGAVPEVVEEGKTGIIVETVEEAVDRLLEVWLMSREGVRRRFEERFTSRLAAERHRTAYGRLLA